MEDREYKAIVEKNDIVFPILISMLFMYYVGESLATDLQLEFFPNMDVQFWSMIIMLIELVMLLSFLNRFGSFTEEVIAIFKENEVVFIRNKKERVIPYAKIKNVVKIMVMSQYRTENGYYKVSVRVKGKNYVLFSGEDADKHLDFEQTEISKIYYEFKNRGILCC